jgi:two-component system OmpR family sensor kinase
MSVADAGGRAASDGSRVPRWRDRLPLRWRLAVLLGGVFAAMLAVVVAAVGVAAERALVDATAERLEISAGLIAGRSQDGPPTTDLSASEIARLLGGQGTAVAVLGEAGNTLAAVDNGAPSLVGIRLPAATYARIIETGLTVRDVVVADGVRTLVVSAPILLSPAGGPGNQNGGGPPFVPPGQAKKGATEPPGGAGRGIAADESDRANAIAQLVVSLAPVDAAVGELRAQIAALGLLVLVGGLGATAAVTRRTTRPLDHVAHAARRFADGDLDARTGLAGTDEVGSVGRAFDAMADRLEAAFRAQRAFAADASHELRTPLTVLGGYVDVLARRDVPADEERRLLGAMRAEIDRLARLAGDLLVLTQIEAGGLTLDPRPFDLADLAREVAASGRMIDATVAIDCEADGPLRVQADPDRIAQAMRNLLENAIRHTLPGTPVEVRAGREGSWAIVDIVNRGSPIPPGELTRLFERFVRRSASDAGTGHRPAGGSGPESAGHAGLGLPISRALVEASGGTVEASSDAYRTTFTIRLPTAPDERSQPLLSEPRASIA